MLSNIIIEDFNTLWLITESIYETYRDLCTLERDGEKETPKYESLKNALESSLALEKDIYSRFPRDAQTINNIYKYFIDTKGIVDTKMKSVLEDIIKNDKKSLVARRIHHNLVHEFMAVVDEREISSYLIIEGINNMPLKAYMDSYESSCTDYLNTLLVILNEYLCDERFKYIQGELFQVAYNCFFIDSLIESEVKDYNMSINPELYWQSPALKEYYKLDAAASSYLKEVVAHNVLGESGEYLFNNYPYNFIRAPFYYFMAQIVLRTSALFLGDTFEDVISGYSFDVSSNAYQILQNRLNELKEMIAQDKNLPQIIIGLNRG